MQQDTTTQMIDPEPSAHVTFLAVQYEVGITRKTLKKYLGIEPNCFHLGTRSLYISCEAMAQVKCLKQNLTLLARVPSPAISPVRSEGKDTADGL